MLVPTIVVVSLACSTVAGPQLSEAVGGLKLGDAVHAIVVSGPGEPMVGGVSSSTVIVCVWLLLLPQESVAW